MSRSDPALRHADHPLAGRVLTTEACAFLTGLERSFREVRRDLLDRRDARQARFDDGELPGFAAETSSVRARHWRVTEAPKSLLDRRVEITAPTDRGAMVDAMRCGAEVFTADLEDANTPSWDNMVTGQANLQDAVRRSASLVTPEEASRLPGATTTTLVVRPRGWHLEEAHALVDGRPMSASLFDFGCYAFHNAEASLEEGFGPFFSLPKLEGHLEARLWAEVFDYAERELGLSLGTIRATVLIETVVAAFEMDEILYELRDHVCGLGTGRRDYLFSIVKTFAQRPDFVLPDRSSVTMTVPFMRAYSDLLVATCHRRGVHAIGATAGFIPDHDRPKATARALGQVAADSAREVGDGFDGTVVAHPDLVGTARAEFDAVLGTAPNQLERFRPDVHVEAGDLLGVGSAAGGVTRAGLRRNVSVGLRYLASWLEGVGAAAIDDRREDVATAEVSRAQVWQWVHHGIVLETGQRVTSEVVTELLDAELLLRASEVSSSGAGPSEAGAQRDHLADARRVFWEVALAEPFVSFLTTPAYALLG